MNKYLDVRDVIDDLLDTISVEAPNRLVPAPDQRPSHQTESQIFGFMLQDDLQELVDAHRDDTENGCPDDGALYTALFHRYSLKLQRAGASAKVAEQRAGKEAAEEIRKLEEQVEEQLRKQGKQRPSVEPSQPQPDPNSLVVFELVGILNEGWHEGHVEFYVRQDGRTEPAKVEPIDRRLRFVGGNDAWYVIAPKARRSKGVWYDESADVWPNPCMTPDGVRWLRDKINPSDDVNVDK